MKRGLRGAEPVRRFTVAQPVRLKPAARNPLMTDILYVIEAVLPVPFYRIRSDMERFDRVVAEDALLAVPNVPGAPAEDAK